MSTAKHVATNAATSTARTLMSRGARPAHVALSSESRHWWRSVTPKHPGHRLVAAVRSTAPRASSGAMANARRHVRLFPPIRCWTARNVRPGAETRSGFSRRLRGRFRKAAALRGHTVANNHSSHNIARSGYGTGSGWTAARGTRQRAAAWCSTTSSSATDSSSWPAPPTRGGKKNVR